MAESTAGPTPWVAPETHKAQAHAHLGGLDGVRGISVFLVVIFHCLFFFSPLGLVAPFWRNVEFSVEIFFALSGYVLSVAYGRSVKRDGYPLYLGRRIARLIPLHIFTFALILAVFAWYKVGPHLGLDPVARSARFIDKELLPQATLTQSLGTHPLAWNFPSWSLSAELWSSLGLGLIFLTSGRVRQLLIAIAVALSVVLLWRSSTTLNNTYTVWRGVASIGMGALVATLPAKIRVPQWVPIAALIAMPFLMVWLHHGHYMLIWPFLAAGLVFSVARSSGPALWLLETPPFRMMGQRSYSIYLLHAPLLILLTETAGMLPKHDQHYVVHGPSGFLVFVCYFAFVIFLAGFTVEYIEKRGQTFVRKLLHVA